MSPLSPFAPCGIPKEKTPSEYAAVAADPGASVSASAPGLSSSSAAASARSAASVTCSTQPSQGAGGSASPSRASSTHTDHTADFATTLPLLAITSHLPTPS